MPSDTWTDVAPVVKPKSDDGWTDVAPALPAEPGYTTARGGAPSSRAQAEKETITGPETGTEQDWFQKQQDVEKRLRAAGKSDAEIEKDPDWQEASKNLSRSVSAAGTGMAMMGNEPANVAGGLAMKGAAKVLGPVVRPLARTIGRALSKAPEAMEKEAQTSAEALRQKALKETETGSAAKEKEVAETRQQAQAEAQTVEQKAGQQAQQTEAEARQAAADPAKRAGAADKAQADLKARQAVVAAQRAQAQAVQADQVRQQVLKQTRERVQQAEEAQKAAGATRQQAQDLALEKEARLKAAQDGATQLDAEIAQKPGMDKETFGQKIRSIAQGMSDRLKATRAREAKYGETLEAAGDVPRVNTTDIDSYIDTAMEASRNPATRRMLQEVKNLLTTSGVKDGKEVAENQLTLKQADDLRKTLSSWIETKTITPKDGAGFAVDSATAAALKPIQKDLTRAAIQSWPDYARALERHSTLSRPLNVLARNAGIGKILDRNPGTTEYRRDLGEVVGEVLRKANRGNKALDALVEENPDLKNSARLYFSQELFGGDKVPGQAKIATFLKTNESSLKKLGLYDEFKDIKAARAAAKKAIDDATGARDQSLAEAMAAAEKEKAAAQKVKVAEHLRDTAKKRAEEHPDARVIERTRVQDGVRVPVKKETPEAAARRLAKVADENRRKAEGITAKGQAEAERLREKGAREGEAIRAQGEIKAEKIASAKKMFDTFNSELRDTALPLDKVTSKAESMAKQLHGQGLISQSQFDTYLTKVKEIEDKFAASSQAAKAKAAARARIRQLTSGLVYVAAGYGAYRAFTIGEHLFK